MRFDLLVRYETDDVFRILTDLGPGGFTDDDGVFHRGATVGDALNAARIIDALNAAGYIIRAATFEVTE